MGDDDLMWRITGASRIGTGHIARGLICQDSHIAECLIDLHGAPVLVIVVSDGAGSASKSDIGSRLICQTILTCVQQDLQTGILSLDVTVPTVQRWVHSALEAIILQATALDVPPRELAATCLGIVAWNDRAIGWQLGDGAVVVDNAYSGIEAITWPQRGEYANLTSFLVEENDLTELVVIQLERRINRVAVLSDGIQMVALDYANKRASPDFFNPLFMTVSGLPPGRYESVDDVLAPSPAESTRAGL